MLRPVVYLLTSVSMSESIANDKEPPVCTHWLHVNTAATFAALLGRLLEAVTYAFEEPGACPTHGRL
jgi:hypothetical protein